jgi:hypothetical protein
VKSPVTICKGAHRSGKRTSRHSLSKLQEDYLRMAEANGSFDRNNVEVARLPRLKALLPIAFAACRVNRRILILTLGLYRTPVKFGTSKHRCRLPV